MSGIGEKASPKGDDRGSATLWAVGGIAVLCLVMAAVLTFGAVVWTRHRATSAADLAALAGAAYAPYGEQAACGRAQWVADGMHVHVSSCRVANWDVLVEVVAELPGDLSRFGTVTARSRAGPADRSADVSITSADTLGGDQRSDIFPDSVRDSRRKADEHR